MCKGQVNQYALVFPCVCLAPGHHGGADQPDEFISTRGHHRVTAASYEPGAAHCHRTERRYAQNTHNFL